MRSFASDNNSGVHPLVMDAVIKANDNHAVGYGDDPWTAAATAKIKEVFGEMASPFFVFNGTGANTVALQAVTRPFNSILCAETAHINVDECGAPARMTGCAIVTIPAPDGKLTPELIKPRLHNFGVCHHSQPKAVYIPSWGRFIRSRRSKRLLICCILITCICIWTVHVWRMPVLI